MGEPVRNTDESLTGFVASLPQGYDRVRGGRVKTARLSDIEERERLREEFREFKVPGSQFSSQGLRLRAKPPVTIRISQGEEMWFAENDRLNIHAAGQDQEQALQEFETLIIHFYKYYRALEDEKALRGARELKRNFLTTFVEVEG